MVLRQMSDRVSVACGQAVLEIIKSASVHRAPHLLFVGHLKYKRSSVRPSLASACPVKCEAYFTGAAPCMRLQLDGMKHIGVGKPVNGYKSLHCRLHVRRQTEDF